MDAVTMPVGAVAVLANDDTSSLVAALASHTTFETYAAELGVSLFSFRAPRAVEVA